MNRFKKNVLYYFIAAGILTYSTWIFELFLNPRLSLSQSYVSELSVHGQPYAYYFQLANLLGSLLMSTGFLLLLNKFKVAKSRPLNIFITSMLIISLIGIVNALFPMNCAPSQSPACLAAQNNFQINYSQWIHQITAVVMFGGLLFAQLYCTFYVFKRQTKLYWLSLANMGIQLTLNVTVGVICLFDLRYVGVFQRLSLTLFMIWVFGVVYFFKALSNSSEQII